MKVNRTFITICVPARGMEIYMNDLNWVYATCFETVFKAIQVNALTGEYNIIKRPQDEFYLNIPKMGNIEAYAKMITNSGLIYPADISDFYFHFNPVYIRRTIRHGERHKVHTFRRKMGDHYVWVTFEIIIPSSYSESNPYVLYIWKLADNDSRGLEDAMRMLSNVYRKIIRINLSEDTHQEIKVNYNRNETDHGMSVKMSEWFRKFAEAGYVHADDLEAFCEFTSIHKIRMHFRHSKESLELVYRRREDDGEFRWVSMELIPSVEYSPHNQVVILYLRDVNDMYSLELQRKNEADFFRERDMLTGFYNRNRFKEMCKEYEAAPPRKTVAVLFADINGLKILNETEGNDAGDKHIQYFAELLCTFFDKEYCYRINGDEFLVVIPEMSRREISFKTKKMRSIFRKEYNWIAAVGYGFAQKPETLNEIIRDAESSMYMDKHEYYRFHPRYTY